MRVDDSLYTNKVQHEIKKTSTRLSVDSCSLSLSLFLLVQRPVHMGERLLHLCSPTLPCSCGYLPLFLVWTAVCVFRSVLSCGLNVVTIRELSVAKKKRFQFGELRVQFSAI